MKKLEITLTMLLWSAAHLAGQQAAATPQTARQALLEMFFGKGPGTFEKHLPQATRAALRESGALSQLQGYSMLMSQFEASGRHVQTFDAGSTLLVCEDPQGGQKFEVVVENDDLRGDEDEIELSFRKTTAGQAESMPVFPRLTFLMKSEAGIWTMNQITITIRVSLTDPRLLKAIVEGGKQRAALAAATTTTPGMTSPAMGMAHPTLMTNPAVVAAMRTINTAEVTYAAMYPGVGFTCSLSDLDGFGKGDAGPRQAMLIDSGLASGKRAGYVLTLSGCSGEPSTAYRLTAVRPMMDGMPSRTFCTDQTGVIRYSDEGGAAACLASGKPLQ